MLSTVGIVKGACVGVLEDNALQILHNLGNLVLAAHELCHEGQVHPGLLPDRYGQGFHSGVHMVHAALLLDGPFREEISLAL